jgi:hypothetical protein
MGRRSLFWWSTVLFVLSASLTWSQDQVVVPPKRTVSPCQASKPPLGGQPKTEKDSPQGRADWFMRARRSYQAPSSRFAGPAPSTSPADNLGRAFELMEKIEQTSGPGPVPANALKSWQELGPRPQTHSDWTDVSGRVTALAVGPSDPSGKITLYVGTAFGGIWRSVDALSNSPDFKALGDQWRSLSVGSIAIDSSTVPPTIYVGTGEANNAIDSYYGQGIFRSTQEGGWTTPVYSANNGKYNFRGTAVARLLVDPVNPSLIMAAVTTATGSVGRQGHVGIYESPDKGDHWSLKLDAGPATDIIYEPVSKVYYAAVRGKGFYKRQATGAWVHTKGSPFQCKSGGITEANLSRASFAQRDGVLWALITDSNGNPSTPFPGDTGLVQSNNGGDDWIPLYLPDQLFNQQGWYDQFLVAPKNSNSLILGGIDVWITNQPQGLDTYWTNLTTSYNGGLVHPDQHAVAVLDDRRWFVGNDGGIWLTQNGGGGWTNLNSSIGAIQFVSVTPDLGTPGMFLGGSQDNGTARSGSSDSMSRPNSWETTWSGDGGYTTGDPNYTQRIFTENYNVSLFRSDYRGAEWTAVVDGRTINDRSSFYIPYDLMPGASGQIVLGTYRVWRGPEVPACPGAGWVPISDDLTNGGYIQAVSVAPSSNDIVYVATSDGYVHVTHNATADPDSITWASIGKPPLPQASATDPGRAFSALAIHPSDPTTVYLGVMGFNTGHVFKSIDGGLFWKDISGTLPNAPVNWILVDPSVPNDVYVANDLGVWVTSDGGLPTSHWIHFGQGLPHTAILQLKMASFGERMVVAATHGRGAWGIPPLDNPAGFEITADPNLEIVGPGEIRPVVLKILPSGGYNGRATLTCSPTPPLQCSLSSATIGIGESVQMTVQGSPSNALATVSVSGTDGTIVRKQTVTYVSRN